MNKVICFTRPDGGMSFILPAPKEHLERILGPLTEKAYWAHVYERNDWQLKDAVNVHECEHDELPHHDRDFRNAWETDGSRVSVSMPKARSIHMNRIRQARNAKLEVLDREYMKAVGRKQITLADQIEAGRETLRNLPQTFDLEQVWTPEELKILWPTELME